MKKRILHIIILVKVFIISLLFILSCNKQATPDKPKQVKEPTRTVQLNGNKAFSGGSFSTTPSRTIYMIY